MIKTTTKPRRVTYLGTPATVFEFRAAGASGERVSVVEYHGDCPGNDAKAGDFKLTHATGNPMKGTMKVLGRETVRTSSDAASWAKSVLA